MTGWWPPPDVPEPEPCDRFAAHDSHDWQDDDVWLYCPGSDGERPPLWRTAKDALPPVTNPDFPQVRETPS